MPKTHKRARCFGQLKMARYALGAMLFTCLAAAAAGSSADAVGNTFLLKNADSLPGNSFVIEQEPYFRGKISQGRTKPLLVLSFLTAVLAVAYIILKCFRAVVSSPRSALNLRGLSDEGSPSCSVSN